MSAAATAIATGRHYLDRAGHIVGLAEGDAERHLSTRLAPDVFDAGTQLAIAIRFGARALCLPAGLPVPDQPRPVSVASLRRQLEEVRTAIAPIRADDMRGPIEHRAGFADLEQDASVSGATFHACATCNPSLFHKYS